MKSFDELCPSGNLMVERYRDYVIAECVQCSGTGFVPYDSISEVIEEVDHYRYNLKKRGVKLSFIQMFKLAKDWYKEGKICWRCDGKGEI